MEVNDHIKIKAFEFELYRHPSPASISLYPSLPVGRRVGWDLLPLNTSYNNGN